MKSVLRIGNASGYWGDDPKALYRQVNGGRLDYITMDFLAEVTMSIMQKQRGRDPEAGYARDFLPMLESVLPKLLKDRTRIITNAGGVNPEACAEAIEALGKRLGVKPRIAVVYGDDILGKLGMLRAKGCRFDNMETGQAFAAVEDRIESANIYFGAAPVVEALKWEPDIIITGRVTDTGITIGAIAHELGWSLTDWDRMAAGVVAGHILECGSQATGGNFTDWQLVESYDEMGYPICEMHADGSFYITKHPGTGGLVSVDTVREQLFYEMGNAKAYITPDVVADFTTIRLAQDGKDRVKVSGIKGYEPTPLYKVSMAYADGFKVIGDIAISAPDAVAKARKFAELFWGRVGKDFAATSTELLGYDAFHRSAGHELGEGRANEVLLRLGARDESREKLRAFAKQIPGVILGGPPGVAVIGGVPKIQEIVSYWPALMPKTAARPSVALWASGYAEVHEVDTTPTGNFNADESRADVATEASRSVAEARKAGENGAPLVRIALTRSGDKGDTANIGVMARGPKSYAWLEAHLTAQVVKDIFQELCLGRVTRHALPNMQGFNFLLENALGGGGTMSLRSDAQGKTLAQGLARQKFQIPGDVLTEGRSGKGAGSQP
jgi:hypothetical protein